MITLQTIKAILDSHFCEPFLQAGFVRAELKEDGSILQIWIGPRDIEIDSEGRVIGSGTVVSSPPPFFSDGPIEIALEDLVKLRAVGAEVP